MPKKEYLILKIRLRKHNIQIAIKEKIRKHEHRFQEFWDMTKQQKSQTSCGYMGG
jgi:hypothetical protein